MLNKKKESLAIIVSDINFFPNEPVPPVISKVELFNFISKCYILSMKYIKI